MNGWRMALIALTIACFMPSNASLAEGPPPPIEKVHPAVGHSLEDLANQARELKDTLEIGKPAVDIPRTKQELTRMNGIRATVCAIRTIQGSLKSQATCRQIQKDLTEARRRLEEHHMKGPTTG